MTMLMIEALRVQGERRAIVVASARPPVPSTLLMLLPFGYTADRTAVSQPHAQAPVSGLGAGHARLDSTAPPLTSTHHVQVKYVVELARALAQHPAVFRVDLLTRKIKDSKVDTEYGQDEECLLAKEGMGGAFICRLPCGNEMQYLQCAALMS